MSNIKRTTAVALTAAAIAVIATTQNAEARQVPGLGLCIPEYGLQHQFWLDMGNEVGGYSHGTEQGICSQNHPVYAPN